MANPQVAIGGATAPLPLSRLLIVLTKVHFQGDESLSDRIDRLTDVLYRWIWMGSQIKALQAIYHKPKKTKMGGGFLQTKRRSFWKQSSEGWSRSKGRFRVEEVDSPEEEGSREESLTKALPPKDPEYLARLKIKTKIDAIIVISEDTLWQSAQRKQGSNLNISEGKILKIILMLIVVWRTSVDHGHRHTPSL